MIALAIALQAFAGPLGGPLGELKQNLPLFTRGGALICETQDGLMGAFVAGRNNWRYRSAAGVPAPRGVKYDDPVMPETFGCRTTQDGEPVTILQQSFTYAQTSLGWVTWNELRNDPSVYAAEKEARAKAQAEASRPRLCYPTGKCVYTDVHPYKPAPDLGAQSSHHP